MNVAGAQHGALPLVAGRAALFRQCAQSADMLLKTRVGIRPISHLPLPGITLIPVASWAASEKRGFSLCQRSRIQSNLMT